jgi:hypothetical protein
MSSETAKETTDAAPAVEPYEPPKVESVLTAEDLAREIQYAGQSVT